MPLLSTTSLYPFTASISKLSYKNHLNSSCALVAPALSGEPLKPQTFSDFKSLCYVFGKESSDYPLVAMAKILLTNGVSRVTVVAPSINSIPSLKNYSDAFGLLNNFSNFYCLCCDSLDPSVLSALASYSDFSFNKLHRPILSFAPVNISPIPTNKIQSPYLCLSAQTSCLTDDPSISSPALTSAGLASIIACAPSPIHNFSASSIYGLSLPLNQLPLSSLSTMSQFSEISLVEPSMNSLQIVRILPSGPSTQRPLNINSTLISANVISDIYSLIKDLSQNPISNRFSADSLVSQLIILLCDKKESHFITDFSIPKIHISGSSSISIELSFQLPFIANHINLNVSTMLNP